MIKLPVYNFKGEKVDEILLNLGGKSLEFNDDLIAQALRVETNRNTTKSGSAKTRAEVRGGGKKPWKQKGTGRARAGSLRSPLFKGGGVTFGPTGVSTKLTLPTKMKKLAFEQLLSKKFSEKEIIALENIKISDSKTKSASRVIDILKLAKKLFLVASSKERSELLPWRNLAVLDVVEFNELHLSDLIKDRVLVFSSLAAKELSEKLK